MSSRARKRQKRDPSPVKSHTKTLLHFFAKPNSNGSAVTPLWPLKTESDSGGLHDESRRKLDIGPPTDTWGNVNTEINRPRMPSDEMEIAEFQAMEFEGSYTEANDSCSPIKEEQYDTDLFDNLDFGDDEYQDGDFRDDELDILRGKAEDIEDDFDDTNRVKLEPRDPSIDDGPSCPFCNFSFKGLSEEVHLLKGLR